MISKTQHIETLWAVFDELRGSISTTETLPVVLSLYGLRILAASESFYRKKGFTTTASQEWRTLKRDTGNSEDTLSKVLANLSEEIGVSVLKPRFFFTRLGADQLSRAILALDKLEAEVRNSADSALVGEVAEALLARFTDSGARAGNEFTTPTPLNKLTARLLVAHMEHEVQSVYDPACGVAGGLTSVHAQLDTQIRDTVHFFGQDLDRETLFLAGWNLLLHGVAKFTLAVGDTLTEPKFIEDDSVKRFDLVLVNPPFYLVARDDLSKQDRYQRFRFGEVSGRRADFAFVQHALASLKPQGRAAVFMPLTVLSRSFEEKIRANLVHADVLDSCISLPIGTFPATSILATLLLFDQDKSQENRDRVFFMDLTDGAERFRGREYPLTAEDINQFVGIYNKRSSIRSVSGSATLEEIKTNKYSLVPSRYVPKAQRQLLDSKLLDEEIAQREKALSLAREHFDSALAHLDADSYQ